MHAAFVALCSSIIVLIHSIHLSQPGVSCDFWNHFEGDIARAHSMGCTAFRFSLEWHRIVPQRGQIDREAIARYHAMLDAFEKRAPVSFKMLDASALPFRNGHSHGGLHAGVVLHVPGA